MKKVLTSSSGFTLAEVVVAAGMLGVVSLGVMQLMTNMTKGQKKLEQDSTVSTISLRAEQTIRREHNCSATLRDRNLNSGSWVDIDDIFRATDTWRRHNTFDIPANKVPAFTKNTIYGGSKDRVRLGSISYRGFFDSAGTNYGDDSAFTNTADSSYTFVGDAGATDSGVDVNRKRGFAIIRLEFERQVTNRDADDDVAQDQFNKRSFGSEKTYKYIPIQVIVNSANKIESCYSDNENFIEASCDSLDGTIENGDCKNVTIKNLIGPTAPALTVEGNMQVIPDASDGDAGSIGIGTAPNEASDSNVDIAGSVGIGIVSTGTAGDLQISNSAGIGMLPTADSGNLSVNKSVGIGVAANNTSGDLLVNSAAAIGSAMSTGTDGTLKVKTSITVGPDGMAAPPVGSLSVNKSVAIGPGNVASGTDGNLDVNTSASIGAGFDPNNTDGDLRVKNSIRAGGTNAAGLSDGVIESIGSGGKRVTVFDGRITTSENYNTPAQEAILSENDFVTKRWVKYAISSTLRTSDAASTIANYINTVSSEGDTYDSIRRAICSSIIINGAPNMSDSCQVNNISRISTTYNSSSNIITISQTNPNQSWTYQLKDCSQNGVCSNVYSNNWVKGSRITALGRNSGLDNGSGSVTGSRICISGSCRTTFNTQSCPAGEVVVAVGEGGALGCAPHHIW